MLHLVLFFLLMAMLPILEPFWKMLESRLRVPGAKLLATCNPSDGTDTYHISHNIHCESIAAEP